MRIATYNIRHGARPGRWCNHRAMGRALRSLSADVIALQEVDDHVFRSYFRDQTWVAARATGMHGHFAAARSIGPCGRYGNALLSRGPMTNCETVFLDSAREQRLAIVATLKIGDTPLTVISTHLQNRGSAHVHEAPKQLTQLLEAVVHRSGPLVLCGDLNLGASIVEPMLAAAGLQPVESGPTYPSVRPHQRIDWIAVRGLEVLDSTVPNIRSSDHRPLVATVALPQEATTGH